MSAPNSGSSQEAAFRLWSLLTEILEGRKPIEKLFSNREFQIKAKKICAVIMNGYKGLMGLYYSASYDVEDLQSEADMKVCNHWQKREAENNAPTLKDFPNESAFLSYYYVAALHIVFSKLRPYRRELQETGFTLVFLPIDELPIADPRIDLERDCLLRQCLEVLETLPYKQRRAVLLWSEGFSTREIKKILEDEGIDYSHVTIQKWIAAALKRLKCGKDGDEGL